MSAEEQKQMGETAAKAAQAAVCIIKSGMNPAMNRFNTPRMKPDQENR